MKKKLLLITSFFESPFHKNRAPYNEQLFKKLKTYFNIKIIRPIAWTDILLARNKIRKKDYYLGKWDNITIFYPTYYFLPRIAIRLNGKAFYYSIKNTFKRANYIPDIFYTTWAYPDAYGTMLLAQELQKNYILRVHGSDVNDLATRKNIQFKIKEVFNNAFIIISPSIDLKEKIIELNVDPGKIKVIYSGIDKNLFYPQNKYECENKLSLKHGIKRILYIGNFKLAKGALDLLKAVNLLKDEIDDFEVLFIGKGKELRIMKKFITKYKLDKFVNIIGPVKHDKLNPWINSSDCVCLPSYAEGLPNVLLEALACNTNIVATRVGGIPEIIKNADNYLVNPGDIIDLKNKLLNVLMKKTKPTEASISIKTYNEISMEIADIINRGINQFY